MSVIKEFILFAVGMIITVSLAVISINVYSKAEEVGRGIAEREQYALNELKEYDVMRYDGTEVDGGKAISYIRRMYSTRDIPIEVKYGGKSFVVDGDSISGIRDTASVYYLNPLKKYYISVSTDENDAVREIVVEQRR